MLMQKPKHVAKTILRLITQRWKLSLRYLNVFKKKKTW